MVNIQNSFYTQTHKIQLKLKQGNRKTKRKKKKTEQLVDFAHWNYLFLNCAVVDTNY